MNAFCSTHIYLFLVIEKIPLLTVLFSKLLNHNYGSKHSHKKRKDNLEGSLGQILYAAELRFPKILVSRLSQHTSNVNIEYEGLLL